MTGLLVLTDAQVGELIGCGEAMQVVEQAFIDFGEGRASMPSKLYLDFPKFRGDLRVMPATLGEGYAGVKLVNSHSGNPSRGLPVVVGTYLLFDQQTGMPLCLMGASLLTALRTGAASGVATRYLARRQARSLGLVGAGVQALHQVRSIVGVRDLDQVLVWGPDADAPRRDGLIGQMSIEFPHLRVTRARTVAEAAGADIVCTSTPARKPLVDAQSVAPGTHINALGADGPGKQELDPAILGPALVVVDEMDQAIHGGEINVAVAAGTYRPDQIGGTLYDVISGRHPGRRSDSQISVFDSTGLAIQDIAVAVRVYEAALERKMGASIEL